MADLNLRDISKTFQGTKAVEKFDLHIDDGELVCLLGPSGSGKSTVLRMIGGFLEPSTGSIEIAGENVSGTPPERRPTGMVFQSHALWTHMNVFGNIAFGLRLRRLPRKTIREKVEAVLDLVGLKGFGDRQVHQLSGGQQQRVALARSLVLEPKILLLDEPFASLDQHLRERLREEVRDIQHRLKITMLFVTHAQDEALELADRIVVMNHGRIEQVAPPGEVYHEPKTPFVAGFIGAMNMIAHEVRNGRFQHPDFPLPAPIADGPAILAVRPEALAVETGGGRGGARVHRMVDHGTHVMADIDLPDRTRLKALLPHQTLADGQDGVSVSVGRYALYRDNAVVHRGEIDRTQPNRSIARA